ncbi:Velvet factor [Mycena venus]|uniref:Velvet factor n=1 Tax=Mycena venus TaxID=2733690 RepID=A0A8H6YDT4_9AGAR|nr:Velvet factor [Mycena venus]
MVFSSRCPESIDGSATLRPELVIRQMPAEARASTKKQHERRALDPLPAIELQFFDAIERRVHIPLYKVTGHTLFAELVGADSEDKVEYLRDEMTEALCGVFISSLFPIPDPETPEPHSTALLFAFPDLGVRATGHFRLRFTLSLFGATGCTTTPLAIYSPPFRVVTAANYGGVQNSTPITRALAAHGAHARIRKKARGANPRSGPRHYHSPASSVSSFSLGTPPHPDARTTFRNARAKFTMLSPSAASPCATAAPPDDTVARGASRAGNGSPTFLETSSGHPQGRGPSVKPIDLTFAAEVERIAGEVWEALPSAFDDFLADWYSDGTPIVFDDDFVPKVGWMN